MHSNYRTVEDSPLLAGEAGMMRGWGDTGRQGSARALLEEARDRSRRRSRHEAEGGGGGGGAARTVSNAFRRKWRVSAGVAGVVMFSMALAGLLAIFSTIQRQRPPGSSSALEQVKNVVPVAPISSGLPPSTAATATTPEESRERGEQ